MLSGLLLFNAEILLFDSFKTYSAVLLHLLTMGCLLLFSNPEGQRSVFCASLFVFISVYSMGFSQSAPPPCMEADFCPVVPTDPLVGFLERVQDAALRTYGITGFDPKFYVDLFLKHDNLSTAESTFSKLMKLHNGCVPVTEFEGFIRELFGEAGDDLVVYEPKDYLPTPEGFLSKVEHKEVRTWALEIHRLWKNLSRQISDSVKNSPDLHTLLPLPMPVMIPGSRFREVYYWDSFWVIRGLLASKMYTTAKSIVSNLIYLVDTYGYVLNGARVYYTNRSQPPLLSSMIYEIYNRTGDVDLIKNSLPALLKEYDFWNSGFHRVVIQDDQGCNHTLSRYFAMWNKPRPESSTIDLESASGFASTAQKQLFYREIATAAESGWDFSTRWMRDSSNFTTLSTTSVVPVDLNAFLLKMELDIAYFTKVLGEKATSQRFLEASQARKKAFDTIFWNEEMGQWLDYWLSGRTNCKIEETEKWKACNQNHNAFASNFIPLWIELFNSDSVLVKKATKSLRRSGLLCASGIATSLTNSGQQWDLPNGWAPLQHMIVEGLVSSRLEEARSVAEDVVARWIRSNYAVFKKTGAIHEKLDVEKCGESGGGGEYVVQTGFGWSNGVILAFLEEFGWPQDRKITCETS